MTDCYGLSTFDGDGRFLFVSHTVGGFKVEDVIGQKVWMESSFESGNRNSFAECLFEHRVVDSESYTRAPDGNTYLCRYTFFPLPRGNHRVACVWNDPTTCTALTEQEAGCLRMLADGMQYAEMSERLFITESGVKAAIMRARLKLNARTPTHAVALAMRHGLLGKTSGGSVDSQHSDSPCPVRLAAQDSGFSARQQRFKSATGYCCILRTSTAPPGH